MYGLDCPPNSFPEPYNKSVPINMVSCPFVELYLYGISPFKPDPSGVTESDYISNENKIVNLANNGGAPFSKIYKNFVYSYWHSPSILPNDFAQGLANKMFIGIFSNNKKTVDIAVKIESKFDEGKYNNGNIRSFCTNTSGSNGGNIEYTNAGLCAAILFLIDIK
jgi:hypothetical protein